MSNIYSLTQFNKRSYTTWLLLLVLFLYCFSNLRAEGTHDVAPNPMDRVMLLVGDTNYGNFATLGSPESSRLWVHLNSPTEVLYLGLTREYSEAGVPASTGNYSFRIRRASNDEIVHGPYSINSFVENISSWEEASGPAILNDGVGYSTDNERFVFSPGETGLFYIEFISVDYIGFWDFTVADNGVEIPGRVYSKNWAFRTPTVGNTQPECVWDREFNGKLYSYTTDGFVTQIDFANSGFQGLSFTMAFNTQGPGQTGDLGIDRMSIPDQNVTDDFAEHLVFLAPPDPVVFPDGECGELTVAPYFTCTGDGTYCLEVEVTQPGQIEIILDINQNGVFDADMDRRILHRFLPGDALETCLDWDGLLANGNPAPEGTNLNLYASYRQGVQHWAVFDVEFLKEGFCVEPIRPLCALDSQTDILYWDDRSIVELPGTGQAQDGRAGCNCETVGCRTWNNFDPHTDDCSIINDNITTGYGDKSTINTWWFANVESADMVGVPLVAVELAGVAEICEGETTTLSFAYTGNGDIAELSWSGPAGLIISGPDAPETLDVNEPGTYTLTVTDENGCSFTDTHELNQMVCPTDLELDITVDEPNSDIGALVTFTITVTNQGPFNAGNFTVNTSWPAGITNVTPLTAGGNLSGNNIDWENLSLDVGESMTLVFMGEVAPAFDYVVNAEISYSAQSDPDSTPGNGVDTNNNGQCADDAGDEDDGDCVEVTPPACTLNASIAVSSINCDPNGTLSDPSDDLFTFSLVVNGSNGSGFWRTLINGESVTGAYGETVSIGPLEIADGDLSLTITDAFFGNDCSETINVPAPASCSDQCELSVTADSSVCDDNGTSYDPADDTFAFTFEISGANASGNWSASDGSTGSYGTSYTYENNPISEGNVSLTFTDSEDPSCSVTYTFIAPTATCSPDCFLDGNVGPNICNDNGTPSDPSDDTFTFTLEITGYNTSASSWAANDPNNTTGAYGSTITMGPYPISGGNLDFVVVDPGDPECNLPIFIVPPPTCSNECGLAINAMSTVCNDNGTSYDPADDTFAFTFEINGSNASGSWIASDGSTGSYGTSYTYENNPISEGDVSLTFTDSEDPSCSVTYTFPAPTETCSPDCFLDGSVGPNICNDNGTPSDPSDDTFTFTLEITGYNTSASSWAANDPNNTTGAYGSTITMGPYPISGGNLDFVVVDPGDPACNLPIFIVPPPTCSNECGLAINAMSTVCNDNGTSYDPADDTFAFTFEINGSNASGSWIASDGSTGSYGTSYTYENNPISEGDVSLTFTDSEDPSCSVTYTFPAPTETCSPDCFLDGSVGPNICNDNGTPSDPSDDTFTFTLEITGYNTSASSWAANDPNNTTGAYGSTITMGPYPISGGNLDFVVVDPGNPDCNLPIFIVPPAPCSNECVLIINATSAICNDNGTSYDPSDDTFGFVFEITGLNASSSWVASDGSTGNYGTSYTYENYPINEGDVSLTFTDSEDPNCSVTYTFTAPTETCSPDCFLDGSVGPNICNDNGTPSDASDDTFTFTLAVTGYNTSTGSWAANDPNNTTGAYGSTITMGPYPISGGNLDFLITDPGNPDCNLPIFIVPPGTCSDVCALTLQQSLIQCDDNGTPSLGDDDTYTVLVRVTGANAGDSWTSSNGQTGLYGEWIVMGPFPIAGGSVSLTFSDDDIEGCELTTTFVAPPSCSTACGINEAIATNITCDDNGTPTDPADDTFTFSVVVTGNNLGTNWVASNGATGPYDVPVNFDAYPISEGDINLVFTDSEDPNCSIDLDIAAPATCSDQCAMNVTAINYQCFNNDTPADPDDDIFTFDLLVEGVNNNGAGWIQPSGNSGTYGTTYTQGPFSIADGSFNMVVQDVDDATCLGSVVVVPPVTCSYQCIIITNLSTVVCDDAGTPDDPSDDFFYYSIVVEGVNTSGSWVASDGTTGNYGELVQSVPHSYEEGIITVNVSDSVADCGTDVEITPPIPALFCPEDTDQRNFTGNIQILQGQLDEDDLVLEDPPCFLALSTTPILLGDRFMEPVDVTTPGPVDTTDNVYSFFFFSDIELQTELEDYGDADGAGMLFRGDYMGYTDPCCFNVNQPDQLDEDDDMLEINPMIDTTGMFDQDMHLVNFFRQSLKPGQDYTLVASTYGIEATGNYAWVIVTERDEPMEVNSEEVSSEFLLDQDIQEDLTYLHINWAQNNPDSQEGLGYPLVEPLCGLDTLHFQDSLQRDDNCVDSYIFRTFMLESAGQVDSCDQLLTFRRPDIDDIVLPPATATFQCGDDYELNESGYPHPQDTGYPLISGGTDYDTLFEQTTYFNLAVSYKDIPNPDTTGLELDLTREWTITDVCNGDTLYVIPQQIKIGPFGPPRLVCPTGGDGCNCPSENILVYDVDPLDCTATVDIPLADLVGFCDESRIEDWSILTEVIRIVDDELIESIPFDGARSVSNLERGLYTLHYVAEDLDGNQIERSCQMRIADLQVPTAICLTSITIEVDNGTPDFLHPESIDLGSYDNCSTPDLLMRRYYNEGTEDCAGDLAGTFGEWTDELEFACCDAGETFLVELQVMDADSNLNGCNVLVSVVDEEAPELGGLENLNVPCNILPMDFDPMDEAQRVQLFGMPEVMDNCMAEVTEMEPELSWDDCELGNILRRFMATDEAGNTSVEVYEQMITVNRNNTYRIRFPKDETTDCMESLIVPEFINGGCGDFTITYEDTELDPVGEECLRVQRTYLIINNCEYDGVSAPTVLNRNENCAVAEGSEDVWLVVNNGVAVADADSEAFNQFPPLGQDCATNPAGYWRDLANVGAWEYAQVINIVDDVAPVLAYEATEAFCTTDDSCEAFVSMAVEVMENCLPERLEAQLLFDQDNDGTVDLDLTDSNVLTRSNNAFLIEGDFPVGDHAFVFAAADGCSNFTSERITFTVADCFIATPSCVTELEVQLSPIIPATDLNGDGILDEGAVIMSAALLAEMAGMDCSGEYAYSINLPGAVADFSNDNMILTCEDRYQAAREIVVRDNANNPYAQQPDGSMGGPNYQHCTVIISVQDANEVCSTCAQNELEIEGVIRTRTNQPLSGVEVQLTIDDVFDENAFTVNDGKFEFPQLDFSTNYEIRPYKNDDTGNGVTTLDLIILQRHLLLQQIITDPYVLLAADVTNDGEVTTLDLLWMQQLLLGRIETFPANTSWRFVPAEFPLTDISADIPDYYRYQNLLVCQFGQDFIGIKIGDLNDSASSDGLIAQAEGRTDATWNLSAPDYDLRAGDIYRIPIRANDLEDLSGLELELELNTDILTVLEVEEGQMKSSQMNTSLLERGLLKGIWLSQNTKTTANEPLFTLVVEANATVDLPTVLAMSGRIPSLAYDHDLAPYQLALQFTDDGEEAVLLKNHPDPFRETTQLSFYLPEAGTYVLEITDATGKVLKKYRERATAGKQQITINGAEMPAGVLFYTLTFNGRQLSRRMVKM